MMFHYRMLYLAFALAVAAVAADVPRTNKADYDAELQSLKELRRSMDNPQLRRRVADFNRQLMSLPLFNTSGLVLPSMDMTPRDIGSAEYRYRTGVEENLAEDLASAARAREISDIILSEEIRKKPPNAGDVKRLIADIMKMEEALQSAQEDDRKFQKDLPLGAVKGRRGYFGHKLDWNKLISDVPLILKQEEQYKARKRSEPLTFKNPNTFNGFKY